MKRTLLILLFLWTSVDALPSVIARSQCGSGSTSVSGDFGASTGCMASASFPKVTLSVRSEASGSGYVDDRYVSANARSYSNAVSDLDCSGPNGCAGFPERQLPTSASATVDLMFRFQADDPGIYTLVFAVSASYADGLAGAGGSLSTAAQTLSLDISNAEVVRDFFFPVFSGDTVQLIYGAGSANRGCYLDCAYSRSSDAAGSAGLIHVLRGDLSRYDESARTTDYRLSSVTETPEPATAAMAATVIAGLAIARRRWNSKAPKSIPLPCICRPLIGKLVVLLAALTFSATPAFSTVVSLASCEQHTRVVDELPAVGTTEAACKQSKTVNGQTLNGSGYAVAVARLTSSEVEVSAFAQVRSETLVDCSGSFCITTYLPIWALSAGLVEFRFTAPTPDIYTLVFSESSEISGQGYTSFGVGQRFIGGRFDGVGFFPVQKGGIFTLNSQSESSTFGCGAECISYARSTVKLIHVLRGNHNTYDPTAEVFDYQLVKLPEPGFGALTAVLILGFSAVSRLRQRRWHFGHQ